MPSPLISVVIPAYNAQATLLETIESVRRQTFSDFELLVIDDGSTDETLARAKSVRDPRIRVSSFANRGLAVSRNRGIDQSLGEFLSFIDADDLWTPDKLERQLGALRRHPEAALAYSWTAFLDADGRFLFAKEPSHFEGDVFGELVRHAFIASGSNILVRRDCAVAAGGFDASLEAAQDWDFCLRIAALRPFALVPSYQILYRIGEDSMSADAARIEQSCLRVCERAFARAPTPVPRRRAESLSNVKQYVAFLHLSRVPDPSFPKRAARKLTECIRLHPPTLLTHKTWQLLLTSALLPLLPARLRRPAVIGLLRIRGHWSRLWRSDVRALIRTMRNARIAPVARLPG